MLRLITTCLILAYLTPTSTIAANAEFQDCSKCPKMVIVPAGSFIMGSPDDEPGRENDEGPQHKVIFSRPFAVGKFAVTFDEWDACIKDGGCGSYKPDDEKWGRGKNPVINIAYPDAISYVAWLSEKTGHTYRLLSEAEREYVTRAGTTTPFWWGTTITTNHANFDGKISYDGSSSRGIWRKRTTPAKSFKMNPFGLYNVHGNVSEWVADCWNDTYEGAPVDGSAWITGDCSERILRGGSWMSAPRLLRSAARSGTTGFQRSDLIGFRVARSLKQ